MRGKICGAIVKFSEIKIDFYYKILANMQENLTFPMEVSLNFYAPFLVHNPLSAPILIEKVNEFKNNKFLFKNMNFS